VIGQDDIGFRQVFRLFIAEIKPNLQKKNNQRTQKGIKENMFLIQYTHRFLIKFTQSPFYTILAKFEHFMNTRFYFGQPVWEKTGKTQSLLL